MGTPAVIGSDCDQIEHSNDEDEGYSKAGREIPCEEQSQDKIIS